MAPLTPFLTDWLWERLSGRRARRIGAPVGLAEARSWARSTPSFPGRSTWCAGWSSWAGRPGPSAKVKTRQPLRRALVRPRHAAPQLPQELRREMADELNVVVAVEPLDGELVDIVVKPNFRALGKRFGSTDQGGRGR